MLRRATFETAVMGAAFWFVLAGVLAVVAIRGRDDSTTFFAALAAAVFAGVGIAYARAGVLIRRRRRIAKVAAEVWSRSLRPRP